MAKARIKARVEAGITTVSAMIKHPMESGRRKDAVTGELIPANYIREVVCCHNDQVVMTAWFGTGVAKNPFLSFHFAGAKPGDPIRLQWTDINGKQESVEVNIKE